MEICDFCGKEVEATKGTSMTGAYCIECLRLTIAECQGAIKELRRSSHKEHMKKPKGNDIEEDYNAALNKLMSGPSM